MAPSRALLRTNTTTCIVRPQSRPSPRLLSTACRIRTPHSAFIPAVRREQAPALRSGFFPLHHVMQHTRTYAQQANPSAGAVPEAPDHLSEGELHVFNKIVEALQPSKLEVQDISGGCGSMYALEIESARFKGLTVIKQHKLVNEVLKEEISQWHGVQLRTRAP